MRTALFVLGIAAIVIGALWIGQGMGWILWPPSSVMLSNRRWAWIGAALVVLGLVLVLRRRRRPR